MHGIKEFDGKSYLTRKPAVQDHLTDEGRDEIDTLIKWAENVRSPSPRTSKGIHWSRQ